MSLKHKMVNSVIIAVKNNKDGSYRTQGDRRLILIAAAKTLHQLGFKMESFQQLKQKHLYALVKHWQSNGCGVGTIKNRMTYIRWLMRKFDKANVVPSNQALNIGKRVYVSNQDKSRLLTQADLSSVSDPMMRHSLKGQKLFGFRLEESLKIQPFVADAGQFLWMKPSWTKGGRERTIPILTQEQRDWLEDAKVLVKYKGNSLIPTDTSYKTYRKRFEQTCRRAGINHRHGLRHLYAQARYQALTAWPAPVKGGYTKQQMTVEQKSIDRAARLQLSAELGHSRIDIVNIYCGK